MLSGIVIPEKSGFGQVRVGGSGISQAVSLVTRTKFKGNGWSPCVQVPTIELPSALKVPL
jgi:hypothetical protein